MFHIAQSWLWVLSTCPVASMLFLLQFHLLRLYFIAFNTEIVIREINFIVIFFVTCSKNFRYFLIATFEVADLFSNSKISFLYFGIANSYDKNFTLLIL
ncbi:hypothetical protein DERF_002946 [Dermatophagoides farinae]|uniref:Uncharacterized protein n=1 Tax=Dermatophagoides farinae TaxID=6954 RepID=A0A922IE50_DERFA|nr:hypothetical protein DERF_002946 [Dermatophagoides farinae]